MTANSFRSESFDAILGVARRVKETYVDSRIDFYNRHLRGPGVLFRAAGVAVIVMSATLPALSAAAALPHRTAYLTGVSIAVAALTGLTSFFRWERTWRGYAMSKVAMEQHVAKWELELANAEFIVLVQNPEAAKRQVYQATMELLASTGVVVTSEGEGFFSALQMPQRSEPAPNGR